jgi:hypothetical protein
MSLPQETMLQLMALADGELEGEELSRMETLVAESAEARQVVEAIRSPALGAWLDDDLMARAVAADGIADGVMSAIAKADGAEGAAGGRGQVVRLGQPRARGRARLQVVGGAFVAALALAAGVVIYVSSVGPVTDPNKASVASVGSSSVDVVPPPPGAVAQRPSQGVEVNEVDSPSRGFSVFEIPVGGGANGTASVAGPSSVVIMIDDDPGPK